MPSVFPELYNYSYVAPFLLRLAVGAFFLAIGFKNVKELGASKIIGGLEFLCGIFLLIGLFVQPAAVAILAIIFAGVIFKFKTGLIGLNKEHYGFHLFLSAILLSLIVLGPGIFSFDLPL